MKLHGVWLVLAARVIVDATTQNLTVVSCLEQVAAAEFPSVHPGFAVAAQFRCVGSPPAHPVPVEYRLMRLSEVDPPEVVAEYAGDWGAGSPRARLVTNFRFLRLKRADGTQEYPTLQAWSGEVPWTDFRARFPAGDFVEFRACVGINGASGAATFDDVAAGSGS